MTTYTDIGAAYQSCRTTSAELRDAAHNVGKLLIAIICERGQFPPDVFKPHPVDLDTGFDQSFYVPQAMRFNAETKLWELGTYLVVQMVEQPWPREFLRFEFTLLQTPFAYTLGLANSGIAESFPPSDPAEARAAFDRFADQFLTVVVTHYNTVRNRWLDEELARDFGPE